MGNHPRAEFVYRGLPFGEQAFTSSSARKLPTGKGNQAAYHDGKVEMFSRARYFTISGIHVDGTPIEIFDRQAELLGLHTQLFARRKLPSDGRQRRHRRRHSASDDELISRACRAANGPKFDRLWSGQWEGTTHPKARRILPCAACLPFGQGKMRARMEALFRRSGMMRKKWLRKDYREDTIAKAIAMTADTWEPGGPMPTSHNGLEARGGSVRPRHTFLALIRNGQSNWSRKLSAAWWENWWRRSIRTPRLIRLLCSCSS